MELAFYLEPSPQSYPLNKRWRILAKGSDLDGNTSLVVIEYGGDMDKDRLRSKTLTLNMVAKADFEPSMPRVYP